jgi:ribosomal protein S18 acetylase RimI-like enzyme
LPAGAWPGWRIVGLARGRSWDRAIERKLLQHNDSVGSIEKRNEMASDNLRLLAESDPSPGFRVDLGQRINEFHGETVPLQSARFGLRLIDSANELAGGLSGVMSWGWLFIDAVWVRADQRGKGAGRRLMAAAEKRATEHGCHAVWLDSFQARGFYESLGYTEFGALEHYPAQQTRTFLRRSLPRG